MLYIEHTDRNVETKIKGHYVTFKNKQKGISQHMLSKNHIFNDNFDLLHTLNERRQVNWRV